MATACNGYKALAAAAAVGALSGAAAAAAVLAYTSSRPRRQVVDVELAQRLRSARVVPVLVIEDPSKAAALAKAIYDGGFSVIEVAFRSGNAKEVLREMAAAEPRVYLGAGTVLTTDQAADAVSCGAKFIATPGLNSEVLRWCLQRKIPVIPGVATPSEVQEASRMGLTILKFFPAEVNGGMEGLKAICAPFPHLSFYPSGGVTEKNLQAYLSLKQVIAVGGSWMVPQDAISGGDPELLKTLAFSTLQVARSIGQASDGKVATASIDHTARLWSIDTGDCLMTFSGHADQVMCVSFSPDGELLATASTDKTAKLWLQTGQCIVTCVGHSGPVYTAFFSPDGCNLLTSSHDRTVKIWDTTSGLLTATLSKFERSIHSAVYSPDGQLIATAIDDPEVSIWSAKTLERVKVLSGHDMKVFSVQFSHDGNLLLTASMDQSARIIDVHTGQTKLVITGHDDWLRCAAFSPDSLKVVTASGDGMAKTWSAVTGRPLLSLAGHEDWLRMAAFSADGRCVVTASKDGSARVWRSDNGECLRKLDGHKAWVRWAAFAPNRHQRPIGPMSIGEFG